MTPDGGQPARELLTLAVVRRLVWGLFVGGIAMSALALVPYVQLAGPILMGFGLGLMLSAMLLSGTLLRCPKCRASLRGGSGRVCFECGAPTRIRRE